MGLWEWLTGSGDKESDEAVEIEEAVEQQEMNAVKKTEPPKREVEHSTVGRRYRRDLRIDGDKLRKAIAEKGFTNREVSLQLGRAQSFVSTNCVDGFIKSDDLKEICEIINADPNDFIVTGQDPGKETSAPSREDYVIYKLTDIQAKLMELTEKVSGLYELKDVIITNLEREKKENEAEEKSTEVSAVNHLEIFAPQERPEWAEKPTYDEFAAYCAKLDSEIDVDKQWKRLEDKNWDAFDWKRSINGVYAGIIRRRRKMIPSSAEEVAEYFVACGMPKNVAGNKAKLFIEYYEKHGWYPKNFPSNPWLPKDGWKTYAAKWARNYFEWKGETA